MRGILPPAIRSSRTDIIDGQGEELPAGMSPTDLANMQFPPNNQY